MVSYFRGYELLSVMVYVGRLGVGVHCVVIVEVILVVGGVKY